MNKNNRGANTNVAQMVVDCACLILTYAISRLYVAVRFSGQKEVQCIAIAALFIVVYIVANKGARIYDVTLFFYFDRFVKIVTKSFMIAVVTTIVVMFFFEPGRDVRTFYFVFLFFSYMFLLINVIISRFVQMMMSDHNAPRAGFVGIFEDYEKFNYFLNKTSIRLKEVGFITWPGRTSQGISHVLGDISDLENIIRENELDQVYFFRYKNESADEIQPYVDLCIEMGITVRVVMDAGTMRRSNSYVSSVGVYPMITYHTVMLNGYEKLLKRIGDILISVIGIVVASPIMLVTAAAIKMDSPGPVLFKQQRVGQNGRLFYMYKFRSMCEEAESLKEVLLEANEIQSGLMFKIKDDPRVTRVGRFIRRTSIDELPQLFNVLIGNMSLVGTRPPTVDEVARYGRKEWRRISIKPGITGIWQVSGRSDVKDFDEIVKMDLRYIDGWSLSEDIQILFRTVAVIIGHKGAY